MCGIFGVAINDKSNKFIELKNIKSDLKILVKLSQKRGSDTFGFSIMYENINKVYKINEAPKKALKRDDLKNLLIYKLGNRKINEISLIGQTRLVTNGSKFTTQNNQPLLTENIVGVHNGILTNYDIDNGNSMNKESTNERSDSLLFYRELSSLVNNNFEINYFKLLKKIKGNFSIAFTIKNNSDIFISSNCGSLFYYYDENHNYFTFASEKTILKKYVNNSSIRKQLKIKYNPSLIKQCINNTVIYNPKKGIKIFDNISENKFNFKLNYTEANKKLKNISNKSLETERFLNIKRCAKCVLPTTYPFIKFDNEGICNFCNDYEKQIFLGEKKLNKFLEQYRSNNNKPDCLVGLSGGRDSCYGLHILKTKYKMNPIAYTYDWGLTTDSARINAAKVCGKLGVQHIIRAANIEKKRSFVRDNLFAWLKKPHLGMLPIIQAGDKEFFSHGRVLAKELNLKLVIHCTGLQLEQRDFFIGFTGVNQKLKNNQSMYSYNFINKLRLFFWYGINFIKNPSYINKALLDNLNAFFASFLAKDNFLHLYNYEEWNEQTITNILRDEYDWFTDKSYGKNQWRVGDGQTAFNNYVYYTLAGFSEFDQFRSNQIREGLITKEKAIEILKEDNKIKYQSLKSFSDLIGFNLDDVLSKISCIPKLY